MYIEERDRCRILKRFAVRNYPSTAILGSSILYLPQERAVRFRLETTRFVTIILCEWDGI